MRLVVIWSLYHVAILDLLYLVDQSVLAYIFKLKCLKGKHCRFTADFGSMFTEYPVDLLIKVYYEV